MFEGKTNTSVQGKNSYNSDISDEIKLMKKRASPSKIKIFIFEGKTNISVQKQNSWKKINHLISLLVGRSLKKEKVNKVCKLLEKHYGDDWRDIQDLNFYTAAETFFK